MGCTRVRDVVGCRPWTSSSCAATSPSSTWTPSSTQPTPPSWAAAGSTAPIHRRGGAEILAACKDLRAGPYRDGLPAGQAVATTAGRLPARWVIHTVGPVWAKREDRSALLESCYRTSLRVADELGAASVAFPAVSAGVYRWPLDDAARIAVETVRATTTAVQLVRFVLFNDAAYRAFRAVP